MYAAMYNQIHCAKYLLQFGANTGTLDSLGRDAMTYAKMNRHEAFIKLLKVCEKDPQDNSIPSSSSSMVCGYYDYSLEYNHIHECRLSVFQHRNLVVRITSPHRNYPIYPYLEQEQILPSDAPLLIRK